MGGRLCLAVTHDLNLAMSFCTRLVVLADGCGGAGYGGGARRPRMGSGWGCYSLTGCVWGRRPGGGAVGVVPMTAAWGRRWVWVSVAVFCVAAVVLPWVGASGIDVGRVLRREGPRTTRFWCNCGFRGRCWRWCAVAGLVAGGGVVSGDAAGLAGGCVHAGNLRGVVAGCGAYDLRRGWIRWLGLPANVGGGAGGGVCGAGVGGWTGGCFGRGEAKAVRVYDAADGDCDQQRCVRRGS